MRPCWSQMGLSGSTLCTEAGPSADDVRPERERKTEAEGRGRRQEAKCQVDKSPPTLLTVSMSQA